MFNLCFFGTKNKYKAKEFPQRLEHNCLQLILSAAVWLVLQHKQHTFVGKLLIAEGNLRILARVTGMSHLLGMHG